MSVPNDRKYLETHEWHRLDGDTVVIGITQIAADELTDITFVSLPQVGAALQAGRPFGEIESVKATADLISGVTGSVSAVNDALSANPGLINKDPYAEGWMIKVKATNSAELERLLPAEQYLKKVGH